MRSLTVVLPASMCAMMPMFRMFESGTCLGMVLFSLPAGVRSRLREVVPAVKRRRLCRRSPRQAREKSGKPASFPPGIKSFLASGFRMGYKEAR